MYNDKIVIEENTIFYDAVFSIVLEERINMMWNGFSFITAFFMYASTYFILDNSIKFYVLMFLSFGFLMVSFLLNYRNHYLVFNFYIDPSIEIKIKPKDKSDATLLLNLILEAKQS